ncbi:Peptidase M13, partial [Borealophlyctis nickersoniae]
MDDEERSVPVSPPADDDSHNNDATETSPLLPSSASTPAGPPPTNGHTDTGLPPQQPASQRDKLAAWWDSTRQSASETAVNAQARISSATEASRTRLSSAVSNTTSRLSTSATNARTRISTFVTDSQTNLAPHVSAASERWEAFVEILKSYFTDEGYDDLDEEAQTARRQRRTYTLAGCIACFLLILFLAGALKVALTKRPSVEPGPWIPDPSPEPSPAPVPTPIEPAPVCTDPHCIVASARILQSLDTSVDPCDNFYEYACGGWDRAHDIPEYETVAGIKEDLDLDALRTLHSLISNPSANASTLIRLHAFYGSCIQSTTTPADTLQTHLCTLLSSTLTATFPIYSSLFPSGSHEYSPSNVSAALAQTHQLGVDALMSVGVGKSMVAYGRGDVVFGFGSVGDGVWVGEGKRVYVGVVKEVLEGLGEGVGVGAGEVGRDWQDVAEGVVEFEDKVREVMRRSKHRVASPYTPATLSNLTHAAPLIPWKQYLSDRIRTNITVNGTLPVTLTAPIDYFRNISRLIKRTDPVVLQDFLIWQVVKSYAPYAGDIINGPLRQVVELATGVPQWADPPRWQECTRQVQTYFPETVAALLSELLNGPESAAAAAMSAGVISATRKSLKGSGWMEESSRVEAEHKLALVNDRIRIGAPPSDARDFDHLVESDTRLPFMDRVARVRKWTRMREMRMVGEGWVDEKPAVGDVDAPSNTLIVPASIVHTPFVDVNAPAYLSYGSLAARVGSAVLTSVDRKGQYLSNNYTYNSWYTAATLSAYINTTTCQATHAGIPFLVAEEVAKVAGG